MIRTENKRELIHSDISEKIIGCCFEVMKELGSGFLEKVYKNALFLAMKQANELKEKLHGLLQPKEK
jgi:hypothetical protein